MSIMVRDPLDPKISMWHFLAYYLRFLREKEGLSLAEWGKIIGMARSSVSNIEAGRAKLQADYARRLDVKFETGGLIELLLWYSRTAHDPNWLCDMKSHASSECMIGGRWKVDMHSRLCLNLSPP